MKNINGLLLMLLFLISSLIYGSIYSWQAAISIEDKLINLQNKHIELLDSIKNSENIEGLRATAITLIRNIEEESKSDSRFLKNVAEVFLYISFSLICMTVLVYQIKKEMISNQSLNLNDPKP